MLKVRPPCMGDFSHAPRATSVMPPRTTFASGLAESDSDSFIKIIVRKHTPNTHTPTGTFVFPTWLYCRFISNTSSAHHATTAQ